MDIQSIPTARVHLRRTPAGHVLATVLILGGGVVRWHRATRLAGGAGEGRGDLAEEVHQALRSALSRFPEVSAVWAQGVLPGVRL